MHRQVQNTKPPRWSFCFSRALVREEPNWTIHSTSSKACSGRNCITSLLATSKVYQSFLPLPSDNTKPPIWAVLCFARSKGFEPSIFSVTGRRVNLATPRPHCQVLVSKLESHALVSRAFAVRINLRLGQYYTSIHKVQDYLDG